MPDLNDASDTVGLVPVDHDPFADFRPSTNVEDYRNEGVLDKLGQQFQYQLQKLREDPVKFILHGGDSFANDKPQY